MNDLSPYNDIQLHPCVLIREESNASSPLVQNSVTDDRYRQSGGSSSGGQMVQKILELGLEGGGHLIFTKRS